MMERTVLVPRPSEGESENAGGRGRETDRWDSRLSMMLAKHQAVSARNLWWADSVDILQESYSRSHLEWGKHSGKFNISWFEEWEEHTSLKSDSVRVPLDRSDVQKWLNKWLRKMSRIFSPSWRGLYNNLDSLLIILHALENHASALV